MPPKTVRIPLPGQATLLLTTTEATSRFPKGRLLYQVMAEDRTPGHPHDSGDWSEEDTNRDENGQQWKVDGVGNRTLRECALLAGLGPEARKAMEEALSDPATLLLALEVMEG